MRKRTAILGAALGSAAVAATAVLVANNRSTTFTDTPDELRETANGSSRDHSESTGSSASPNGTTGKRVDTVSTSGSHDTTSGSGTTSHTL